MEKALIKPSRVGDNLLPGDWVPEQPALVAGGIPNEHTLLGVALELFSMVLLDMHIAGAAKDSKMRHIWL